MPSGGEWLLLMWATVGPPTPVSQMVTERQCRAQIEFVEAKYLAFDVVCVGPDGAVVHSRPVHLRTPPRPPMPAPKAPAVGGWSQEKI